MAVSTSQNAQNVSKAQIVSVSGLIKEPQDGIGAGFVKARGMEFNFVGIF
jgi:hypothetical protein